MSPSTIVLRIEAGEGRPLAPMPCLFSSIAGRREHLPGIISIAAACLLGVFNRALIAVVRQKEEAPACASKVLISNRKTDRSMIREAEN